MNIQIINKNPKGLPQYATAGSAGMDLYSNIETSITIQPGTRLIVPTGVYIILPKGYEAQIRSRSGLAAKHGICVLNSPGTIDSDYRGEIAVILHNSGDQNYTVSPGDRIAQMVVARYETVVWEEVTKLNTSERGEGGFGSTGV